MAESLQRIAWALIVKGTADEAPLLKQCLESLRGHVDAFFINVNAPEGQKPSKAVLEVARAYTDNVYETVWENDFAKARNFITDQIPEDFMWYGWCDSDDTIDKPHKIRDVCEASGRYDSVYVDYEYDHDEQGNPLTVHMVARLIQNNGSHKWKGSIHETLVEQRSATQGMTKDFMVIHHADEARTQQSYDRNIYMLEAQIEAEQTDPDPRTFYYLASTYMDSGLNEGAKQLFADYLTMSGWDQERCVAETKLGRIFLSEGDRAEAKKHFMLAIGEDPDSPDPRVEMGSLELEMEQYRKAQAWLEYVLTMEVHQTTLERNPMTYTFRTYLLLADTYLGLGGKHLEKALEYAQKAQKFKRKDKDLKAYVKTIKHVVEDKSLTEKILAIAQTLKKNKEEEKIELLLQATPKQLDDNPIIVRLRQDGESFQWPEKSIVIMTGDTAIDAWGPWSLREGIGGSEEAIIRLAPKLAKLGYKVVVYAKPGADAGFYEGVMWRNFWEWNPEDEFDIFVAWRAPFYLREGN
jgi:tetratricopeptide (TPR) repeat protein